MNQWNWCVPPIKWVQRWFVPPKGTLDWQRIAFQPMLYLCMWIGAILYACLGDITAIEPDVPGELSDAWLPLSLLAPPMALLALNMITHGTGRLRLAGLWLRLGADLGFFAGLASYSDEKFTSGDFHIYSIWNLIATLLFVLHLLIRDVKRLIDIERLAKVLREEDLNADR